jgi:pimeloyl-ACP methyl ester carboxylesterase
VNIAFMNTPATNPRLIYDLLGLCQSMSYADPEAFLRSVQSLQLVSTDRVRWSTQTNVKTASVFIRSEWGTLVLLSGTQGTLHLAQLVSGWENPGAAIRGNGANPAFENAMLATLETLPGGAIRPDYPVRIFGYSYGGAVGQVMADEFQNNLRFEDVECISVASPRAGTVDFQRRMSRVRNTRWFADNDPVRFMPPHIDEVPSVATMTLARTWRGMDTQVQSPTGFQIEADGNITQTEGNPTVLHSVFLSIFQWCFDIGGFQSVNHAAEEYRRRLSLGIMREIPVVRPATPAPLERPANISIGQAAYYEEQGRVDIAADPAATLQPGTPVTVGRFVPTSRVRYKRKKQGGIWVVVLGSDVVAVGPGKRRAGSIARSMNRVASVS